MVHIARDARLFLHSSRSAATAGRWAAAANALTQQFREQTQQDVCAAPAVALLCSLMIFSGVAALCMGGSIGNNGGLSAGRRIHVLESHSGAYCLLCCSVMYLLLTRAGLCLTGQRAASIQSVPCLTAWTPSPDSGATSRYSSSVFVLLTHARSPTCCAGDAVCLFADVLEDRCLSGPINLVDCRTCWDNARCVVAVSVDCCIFCSMVFFPYVRTSSLPFRSFHCTPSFADHAVALRSDLVHAFAHRPPPRGKIPLTLCN